jgi:hypothetical protein
MRSAAIDVHAVNRVKRAAKFSREPSGTTILQIVAKLAFGSPGIL